MGKISEGCVATHDGQPALGANWIAMLKVQGTLTCLTHVS